TPNRPLLPFKLWDASPPLSNAEKIYLTRVNVIHEGGLIRV
ncbi:MAG: hypothetical protein JWN14_3986, partial [Chthonomonadales bacterium]|nr:hypothetical protein [Chthonomonadales bacterium]